ncbi:MAG: DUF5671 domain-containing protein [Devosia sp.]|nr:DUF5671 domain-containing protein [Devosia sp.]
MNVEVVEFTRRALEKGASREQIADVLKQAGWQDADIRAATGAFAAIDFPVPVPKPRPYLSAQEVFTYALFFTAFYLCVFSVGSLAYQLIDLSFPDPAVAAGGVLRTMTLNGMRQQLSTLIVAFPLFLFLFRLINRAIEKEPTKRASRPRKWLTYLTLFIAASALIGDLSTLIYNLLGGELTVRFMLKAATVAVLAGGAFTYFLVDIRQDERS